MNRIRILPDLVANQIAAGEVIERPASVLKELVENSIDAQATHIRIEIRAGGKGLIRVADNAHGMGKDDALLCLERHATSKIHDSADIGAIHTMGFRGEAIPSMAAVSRFRLLTREADAQTGMELDVHGGKILSVKEAGCPVGTQVEVRNLFYNLPARRKFLRSDATELGHLHHVFLLHAIAQPQIAWTLQQDNRTIHELPPAATTDQQVALLARVRALHGAQLSSQLVTVNLRRDGVHIHGLIGKPGLSRSNRSELYCFVNSRPVDSRAIYYGLIEGYHTALMRGRYPVCFLFLEVDPASVDVNVHPAKKEVRFHEDACVQGTVIEAVRQALGAQHESGARSQPLAMLLPSPSTRGLVSPQPDGCGSNSSLLPQLSAFNLQPRISSIQPPEPKTVILSGEKDSMLITILGVFADLYVIAMDADGLIIVDQHAAHERVLFEQMMGRLGQDAAPSQRLLLPQMVELPPKDALELRAQIPVLEKMGFGIAEFGDHSFIVDALPPFVKIETISQLLRSIVDEFNEAGGDINRDRFAEETVAKTVCRHAVKANDVLRSEELERMLIDLHRCVQPFTCPHGRPTILRLTQVELEKKFGRRPIETI